MWEPRRLSNLFASTGCYRDTFNFFYWAVSYNANVRDSSITVVALPYKMLYLHVSAIRPVLAGVLRIQPPPPDKEQNDAEGFSESIVRGSGSH